MKLLFVLLSVVVFVNAAPSAPLEEKLRVLQEQLYAIEKENGVNEPNVAEKDSIIGFVPQKRMVAWQPMKRSFDDSRAPLHAIEGRLAEVLRAGERLGVNPEEVLADLRARNQFQ